MSKLKTQIEEDFIQAFKKGQDLKKRVLSLIKSQIHNKEIEKQQELTNEDIIAVLQTEIKQRKESEEIFRKAGRIEQADEDKKVLKILNSYLPNASTNSA